MDLICVELVYESYERKFLVSVLSVFFFNDTATTEIYTLSLHDALPIYQRRPDHRRAHGGGVRRGVDRSEEHTSELQSPCNLVCRLLLEKKKKNQIIITTTKKKQTTKTKTTNITIQ